jgi:hypothetical protein
MMMSCGWETILYPTYMLAHAVAGSRERSGVADAS